MKYLIEHIKRVEVKITNTGRTQCLTRENISLLRSWEAKIWDGIN